ncbi:DUF4252 domain-containing protein [Christiangramia sabulilitoris]|uniref:DUF4252 domain-containing protein n=1 Tax=Christiangramia sabulilitoris TaxID=2583991 RepID=A0A550I760_9FLAO|nr:DUF4252 domain-containing protein [Christiangramia sabulilitoris]TRO66648.1 DUF4252 domain-containing protein [Christiangramia sabulilitoris]
MKTIKILFGIFLIAVLSSCNDGKSLQKYYVENQEDSDFLALDVPTSMFTNSESLDAEKKATLESIKKINVLALKREDNPEKFEEEKLKLDEIFQNEKYQLLMKYGGSGRKAALYFTGEEDAIDEIIVYGYDNEQGLGIARVLGEDMNPEKIMEMMKSLDEDNIDVEGIKSFSKMFGSDTKTDSSKVSAEESEKSTEKVNESAED